MELSIFPLRKKCWSGRGALGHVTLISVTVIFLLLLLLTPSYGAALVEWNIPSGATSIPYDVVVDSSHQVWFSEFGSDKIGKFTSGTFQEFALSTGSHPWGVDFFDVQVWIAESGLNRIARLYSSGLLEEYALPVAWGSREIRGVAVQNSTRIWFAEYSGHAIGLLNLTAIQYGGQSFYNVTQWILPSTRGSDPGPQAVVWSDSTGLWYVDYSRDVVGNIPRPLESRIREWYLETDSHPWDIDTDSNGNIWFTESGRNRIGKLNPDTNEVTEFLIPTVGSEPFGIAVDYSNRVWFAEHGTNKIGVYVPGANRFTEFTRTQSGTPYAISTDSEGQPPIWFTDVAQNKIGKVDPYIGLTTAFERTLLSATVSSATTYPIEIVLLIYAQHNSSRASYSNTNLARSETFTQSTSYTVPETVTLNQTSTTGITTTTLTSATTVTTGTLVVTLTATSTVTTGTSTSTLTSTTTSYVTETGTTTISGGPIPGYPIESIVAGIGIAVTVLAVMRKSKHRSSTKW